MVAGVDVGDDVVAAVLVVPAAAGRTLGLAAASVVVALAVVLVADAAAAGVAPAGVGGANNRMKAANNAMSAWKPADGLGPPSDSRGVGLSGCVFVAQLGSPSRSLGNRSLVTPISTL